MSEFTKVQFEEEIYNLISGIIKIKSELTDDNYEEKKEEIIDFLDLETLIFITFWKETEDEKLIME